MFSIQQDYQMIKGIEEQFLKHCSTMIKKNETNNPIVNAIKKSQSKFFYCKKIITKAKETNLSYNTILISDFKIRQRKHYKNTKNHKSTFYQYMEKLRNIWVFAYDKEKWNPVPEVFRKVINKTTMPKHFCFKYSDEQIKYICDCYFNPPYDWVLNKINIWKRLQQQPDFYNISLSTVCLYIKRDKRSLKIPPRAKVIHPLRTWDIDIGNIQLDVKVIGPTESQFKRNIYIMDAKDQQSKLYWHKILKYQTKTELLEGLTESIDFFENHGIKIKSIRTDNAMVFKKTNFVKTGEFDKILQSKNIEHEFIPLKEPECNGVIERHHRILDDEVIKQIWKFETIHEFEIFLDKWQDFYNYERFHTYNFIDTPEEKYQIPVEFLAKYLPQVEYKSKEKAKIKKLIH